MKHARESRVLVADQFVDNDPLRKGPTVPLQLEELDVPSSPKAKGDIGSYKVMRGATDVCTGIATSALAALCPLPSALCPLPSARCPLPVALCSEQHEGPRESVARLRALLAFFAVHSHLWPRSGPSGSKLIGALRSSNLRGKRASARWWSRRASGTAVMTSQHNAKTTTTCKAHCSNTLLLRYVLERSRTSYASGWSMLVLRLVDSCIRHNYPHGFASDSSKRQLRRIVRHGTHNSFRMEWL